MIQVRLGPRGMFGFRRYGPGELGIEPVAGSSSFGVKRLPTDPIGTFTLTLTNVVAGSAIQVEPQAGGSTVYNGTAAASIVVINVSAYSVGNANNNLRIKVRKGSASPYYLPWETLVTAIVGIQSVYVSQISDE